MNTEEFSVIDDEELPFGGSNDTKVFKQGICECPICKAAGRSGEVLEGERSFYCTNSRDPETRTCTFVLYKNNIEKLIRREITAGEVAEVCEEGFFSTTCTQIKDETKKYTGIFSLKPMGTFYGLSLSFPD